MNKEKFLYLRSLYDTISRILTDYEEGEVTEDSLYSLLVDIQNSWDIISME